MSRGLIALGLILVLLGLSWPWISKLPLGRLPGDIRIERGNGGFYFPITTSILISILLSLLMYFIGRRK